MCTGSLVIIAVALSARFLSTMLVASQSRSWNWKEKLFAGISWCPKATVQAALCSVALDYVNTHKNDLNGSLQSNLDKANIILTVAVLSILTTAPLFGAMMSWWGLKHLDRDGEDGATKGLLDEEKGGEKEDERDDGREGGGRSSEGGSRQVTGSEAHGY
jgi:NhaP-type Na+/H+ or K+/H+ antiporter